MRRDAAKCADYAVRHHVAHWTTNADELVARADVNAIYVAATPGAHVELALKALQAGKPCLVEKPFTRSAAETRFLCEQFEAANLPLFSAYYRRGLNRFRALKNLIENDLGALESVNYAMRLAPMTSDEQWRVRAQESGGGVFVDLGSHLLDIFDFLFGPLQNVAGSAQNRKSPALQVEDFVEIEFEAAGANGHATWDFADSNSIDKIEIRGANGVLSCSCFGDDDVIFESKTGVQTFPGAKPPHVHQVLIQSIVDQLLGRGEAISTGCSALRTAQVMDIALRDYYGGRDDDFWNRPQSWPGNPRKNA